MPPETPDPTDDPSDLQLWNSRPVTLVLDPAGHLIRLVQSGPQDARLELLPGTPIQELFPDVSGEVGDAWAERLASLRRDPDSTVHVDVPVTTEFADAPGELRRTGTAVPIPGDDGQLAQVVVHLGLAYEVGNGTVSLDQQFQLLAETLPHMLWISRLDGTIEYYSPQWAEFTGESIPDLLTHGIHALVHPDDLPKMMDPERESGDGYGPRHFRLRRHDGVYRWVEALINPVRDDSGTVWRVVGSTSDITDRMLAEQQRAALTAQLEEAAAVSELGRLATDLRSGTVETDERAREILGLDRNPATRAELDDIFPPIHPDDVPRALAAYDEMKSGATDEISLEVRIERPSADGQTEERWISLRGRRQRDERGEVLGSVAVIGDVTERRAENAARLRAQKREAIGTLAGGIAHDFNNVIGAILANAAVAEAEVAAGESPATSLAEIRRGAERAGELVRRLLGFSRDSDARREPFDLTSVAHEACTLLQASLPRGVTVEPPSGTARPAMGSASELHQVLVNLIGNAADAAAEGGGTVEVCIDDVTLAEVTATTGRDDPLAQLPPGRYVRLQVTDDGPGIPEDVLPRIFDPFFTTKDPGRGTGLGLTATQAIVHGHGGEITARSLPGQAGARLTVLLPVADGADPGQGVDGSAATGGSGATRPSQTRESDAPRVMFVDDEVQLASLARRALPIMGCAVEAFTDPVAALHALEADPSGFDALVTDLAMPHLTGLELTAAALTIRPDLPVILSSGYLTPENEATAQASGVREVIPKPCALDELAAAVLRLTRPRARTG